MPEAVNLKGLLEETEKGLILRALKSSGGVQAEAARRLQLSRSDLAYKLTKYDISGPMANDDPFFKVNCTIDGGGFDRGTISDRDGGRWS